MKNLPLLDPYRVGGIVTLTIVLGFIVGIFQHYFKLVDFVAGLCVELLPVLAMLYILLFIASYRKVFEKKQSIHWGKYISAFLFVFGLLYWIRLLPLLMDISYKGFFLYIQAVIRGGSHEPYALLLNWLGDGLNAFGEWIYRTVSKWSVLGYILIMFFGFVLTFLVGFLLACWVTLCILFICGLITVVVYLPDYMMGKYIEKHEEEIRTKENGVRK